jgi:hypothetical protein
VLAAGAWRWLRFPERSTKGETMRGTKRRRGLLALSGIAVVLAVLVMGAGVASADTHTGFEFRITCDGGPATTIVSPTNLAAAGQDVSSTQVFVLAYGAIFASSHFPAGKVQYCDLENVATGEIFEDLPFLILQGPPAK